MFKNLKKAAMFTDIHFGKKNNCEQHNQDCLDHLDWFVANIKKDPDIDHIVFLGDWHENRSNLNILTLKYSLMGAKKLNNVGLPVFFIIGNHDLFHKDNRDVDSVRMFQELENFHLIDEPTIINDNLLLTPYLFHEEYPTMKQYAHIPVWMGHFEFKGFIVSGQNMVMPTGPEADQFDKQRRIFSGHFHKRQLHKNVIYMGNTFPMDFNDADDNDRGMATYEYANDDLQFINWEDCPKYKYVKISDVIDSDITIAPKTRVKCLIDTDLKLEECLLIREKLVNEFNLRDVILEEVNNEDINSDSNINVEDISSIHETVINLLSDVDIKNIDPSLLLNIYNDLEDYENA